MVSVVVWVWGVLLLVAFCLCGFVAVLFRVVCRLGSGVGGCVFVLSGVGVPAFCVAASGSGFGVGGVRVCVPCAVRVFGVSWCSLVLRRWARAAGVGGVKVDVLLGSASGFGSGPVVSGSVLSSGGGVVVSGLFFPRLRLFPVVLCPCACLLVVGVLAWGLVFVFVIGVFVWVFGVWGGVWWWCGVWLVGALAWACARVGFWCWCEGGLVLAGLVGVVVLVSVLVLVG